MKDYIFTEKYSSFLLFAALGVLLYGHTLNVPFYFDDIQNIRDNTNTHLNRLTGENLLTAALKGGTSRRPVANISFALNHFFHQEKVAGYHVVNILIHVTTGFFLFLFLKQTFALPFLDEDRAHDLALACALLWFVHPVQTQAVTYIVQRMTSMSSMFYIISLFLYARGRLKTGTKLSWPWFSASFFAGLLALGSKEIAITLPFIIFCYEKFIIRNPHLDKIKIIIPIISVLILIIISASYLVAGNHPLDTLLAAYHYRDFNLTERTLTQFRVIIFYMSLLLYPHPSRLTLEHDFPLSRSLIDPISTLLAIIAVVVIIALACLLAKKERFLAFAIFWFLGNLALESSILPLEIIFEHRLYLPSMLVIAALTSIAERCIKHPYLKTFFLIFILFIFSFWTYERNKTWQSPIIFNQDMAQKASSKARPRYNLGLALLEAKKPKEALKEFQITIELDPRMLEAYRQLASTFVKLGQYRQAIDTYRKILWYNPENAGILADLGHSYALAENFDLAIQHLERSLQIVPANAEAHNNLGTALQRLGKLQEAEQHYDEALRLNPELAQAHNNKGLMLAARHQYREAAEQFAEALKIEPEHTEARHNLQILTSKRLTR